MAKKANNPVAALARKARKSVALLGSEAVGAVQTAVSAEPTHIATSRRALEQWLHALRAFPKPDKGPIYIVAFRNHTWIEWAVFAAANFYRLGYQPVVVYSGEEVRRNYDREPAALKMLPQFWPAFERAEQFQRVDLDRLMDATAGERAVFAEFAERAAHTITAYNLRFEEYEPGTSPQEYERGLAESSELLARFAAAMDRFLAEHPVGRVICPSGIISWSMAVREVTHRRERDAVFVEGWAMRPGHMIWRVNEIPMKYDLDGWLKVLGGWDAKKEADSRDFAKFQERADVNRAGWLDDFHPVQRTDKNTPLPGHVERFLRRRGAKLLLGTNVIGDSATLRRATIFRSQRDWLEQVIPFFREHEDLNLIIRAHPDEVWARARQKMGDVARPLAEGVENVLVIGGEEDVSSYTLMERCDAGLAWVSNFGLDMVLRGKPVVLAAAAQYAKLGVGFAPQVKEDYFAKILELSGNPQPPSEEMKTRAKMYQHIVFKAMSLRASSPHYVASEYRVLPQWMHPDQEKFYRILAGELGEHGESDDCVAICAAARLD